MAEEDLEPSELDKLLEKTDLEYMLEFETQIFLDVLHKDGLVVAAKYVFYSQKACLTEYFRGLNLELVLLNLFKVYSDSGNLVIVLNASEADENFFINKIKDGNIHSTTFNVSTTDRFFLNHLFVSLKLQLNYFREDAYLAGGIHFITTRILVVDLLKNRVPVDKITGFVIFRAHKVLESCQEAFALRLYRQSNKVC